MGLRTWWQNRISAKLDKTIGTTDDSSAVGKGQVNANFMSPIGTEFQVAYERSEVHRNMDRMDGDDGVMTYAMSLIADRALGMEDVTLDAFEVTVAREEDEDEYAITDVQLKKANNEIRRLNKRLKVQGQSWQIIRKGVKYGNDPYEILWNQDTLEIEKLKPLPEHTVWPRYDKQGNELPGYVQRMEGMVKSDSDIVFADYEILHFRFGEIKGGLGTPLLKSSRKDWNRLNLALDCTGRARLIRAFMKLVHYVPVGMDWVIDKVKETIEAYKQKMSMTKVFNDQNNAVTLQNAPLEVSTDIFIPEDGSKRGRVEMLDPENAQLQNIKDIEHFMDRMICATHIPKRYFPFEGSTPKLSEGGGSAEDKNFAGLLVRCQNMLKEGLSKLYDLQLAAKGIDPRGVRYVWRMAEINTTDQLRYAQTQLALSKAGELMLKAYPEFRDEIEVFLREYARLSADSLRKLSAVELKPLPDPEPAAPDNAGSAKSRTTLPSVGTGSGNRQQV